jgi:dolichol-phosphate mannosyltransferase
MAETVAGTPGVPEYEISARSPKRGRALVGVPVLNEGERIREQLRRMGRELDLEQLDADVVIADGGSTDGALTDDVLDQAEVRAVLTKRGPGRMSAQLRMLFHWAIEQGYDHVVTIDGNGKDGLPGIGRVLGALRNGFDFVQGSRYIAGGVAVNTPRSRHLGVKLVHAPVLSLGARHRYTDTTNGLRGWSTRALADPRVAPLRDEFVGYELHYYLTVRIPRLGYRVTEVPVTRAYPDEGRTPTKITGLKPKVAIVGEVLKAAAGRYEPS